ncbi:N-terminal nucleophile aminohydrolase [Coemansia reversa NRRL 1564]|uniref:N-terminal nucleophile aminohydrolase n=1 Tax=Coemansia reversa (strain ATCC 12441 / NRRL 1564) TaxID=763665 RepID=A0A2G5B6K5_COERN|nr:N-terminal nucleophile aminohydrolase [Coemansia reversa NRRL 1564]|eukprot:PIA14638.1 N-terminal nucleophile aminohydrolase [Coemansia reversa NRRL 1564]
MESNSANTQKATVIKQENTNCYVAVHIGAGYHSKQNAEQYKKVIKAACNAAMGILKQGQSANAGVESAIKVLEDAPITNAGIGSNLNRRGQVECDASIMCTDPNAFGAVGAVTLICNPIQAANAIMGVSSKGPDSRAGLIPPMFLVGHGAESWAEKHGIPTNTNRRHMITEDSLEKYSEYMERAFPAHNQPAGTSIMQINDDDDLMLDTVGAVCIDNRGVISAGVSSGGIALKYPGRIGEAAMFGCGSWAELQLASDNNLARVSGCSVSGTGEQIMRSMLAQDCAQRSEDIFTALHECFERFCTNPSLAMYPQKSAGLILIRQDLDKGSTGKQKKTW